ncbi:MAG: putative hydrolase of the HAD superfamily [Patiriisocius sp.]|jgi:putative hydrolase of the HAD superfamily
MFKAVLWDFGGVLTTSPFEAFNRFESENGLPKDFIRGINSINPETNAWAKFESSEVDVATFDQLFADESLTHGHEVRGQDVLALLSGDVRPEMVKALKIIKSQIPIGCITNNVKTGKGPGMAGNAEKATAVAEVMALFDVVIESSKLGIRKPNPEIYKVACEAMKISPADAIFLDDLGINLKPAKALGMTTIKVLDAASAIEELESHLGLTLK